MSELYQYYNLYESEIRKSLISKNQIIVGSPVDKPRILLMGLQRSGKSSIQKVVFGKMQPADTVYLESTIKIQKEDITRSFIDFQIWDFPGQVNYSREEGYDTEDIFGAVGSLVFVIDAQDDYLTALLRLQNTVSQAYAVNTSISFEILIHKVDGLKEKDQYDRREDIMTKLQKYLTENGITEIRLNYHLTSIYDCSIYKAFSKIIQQLIRELPILENLLDTLLKKSGVERAYLFDTSTKIYIATDSNQFDNESYELCSDMIDVVLDIECIYGPQSGCSSFMKEETTEITCSKHESDNGITECSSFVDREASSIISLNDGYIVYMREVNSLLALICMIKEENYEKHGLIDYNFRCFSSAVTKLFQYGNKKRNNVMA